MSRISTGPHRATGVSAPWYEQFAPRHRDRPGGPDLLDAAIAVACFAGFTGPLLTGTAGGIGSLPAIAACGVAATAPLLLRRRLPLTVLAVVSVVVCAAALTGVRFTPWVSNAGPALGVAVFTLAAARPRRTSITATLIALIVVSVAGSLAFALHPGQDQDAVQPLIALPAWLLGDMVRTRREYRRASADLDRRRAAETERRIRAEERLRISRDVHDLVSHTLSMVAVRSGVARLLIEQNPGEVRDALAAIETASRAALTDLRTVLAQIREPGPPREAAEPGLADVRDLVEGLRHDGLMVDYHSTGTPAQCPALLQTTVYRIVQESLTNVVKHARTGYARVDITLTPAQVRVSITDDGASGIARADTVPDESWCSGSGLGITGMRERVALSGGRFEAGPRAAGGFAVTAHLPIDAPAPAPADADGAGDTDRDIRDPRDV